MGCRGDKSACCTAGAMNAAVLSGLIDSAGSYMSGVGTDTEDWIGDGLGR